MDQSRNEPFFHKEELIARAKNLIFEQSTLTLATARKDIPWAAAVYYVSRGFTLYFFSDPADIFVLRQKTNQFFQISTFFYPSERRYEIHVINPAEQRKLQVIQFP